MLVINCRLQWMAESGSETGDDDWMLSDDEDWEAVARAAEAGGGERADEQRGEHSGDDSDDSDDSSEEEEDEVLPERAGENLLNLLFGMLWAGEKMTAKSFCCILWWAFKAGAAYEGVQKYSYRPSAQSGKFQAHIDKTMGVSTKKAPYRIRLPGHTRGGIHRTWLNTPVEIPYECLLDELEDHVTFEADLQRAVSGGEMPPSYYNHRVDNHKLRIV